MRPLPMGSGTKTKTIGVSLERREAFGGYGDDSQRVRYRHTSYPRLPMSTAERHLELILEVGSDAERDSVMKRLRQLGFDPLAMKVGVLLAGDIESLRR